jgi:DNA-binding CsgD family transcriptional regulator
MKRLHAYPILSPANIRVYDLLIIESDLDAIAKKLCLSKRGVCHHVSEILARTKCLNRTELVIKHYQLNIGLAQCA